jgi:peptide/nickel transport system substrate-binding protein
MTSRYISFKKSVVAAIVLVLGVACSSHLRSYDRDRLVLAFAVEPSTLDPLFLPGRQNEEITALMYSTLLNEDNDGGFTPAVAAVVPTQSNGGISRDGLEIRFHLRHDVRWSDGVRLTADDVAFTSAAITNPRNNIVLMQDYDAVKSVTADDPNTVVVRLKQRYAPILESLNFAILPKHILSSARSLNNLAFNAHPIGSGPYALKKWLRNDRLELVANPYYYRGRRAIREIDLVSAPSDATTLTLLQSGAIDGAFRIDSALLPSLRTLSNYRVLSGSPMYMGTLTFNVRDPILQDIAVRRAVAAAVDLPSAVTRSTHGAYNARNAALPDFRWSYDPNVRYSEYNLARAQGILDSDGWRRGPGGQRSRAGKPLTLEIGYMLGQPSVGELVTQLQAQLFAAGIASTLHGYAEELFYTKGPVGDPHSQIVYTALLQPPDPDQTFMIACDMIVPHGGNSMFYCNKKIDALDRSALDTYDRKRRTTLYRSVQRILGRDLPFIPVFAGNDFSIVSNGVAIPDLRLAQDPFQTVASWRIR